MATPAPKERLIPRVGLRNTLRFQVVVEEVDFLARVFFCKKVIVGQLCLKVEDVYCIQWNQQEKAFDVTLRTEDIYRRVAEICQTAAGVRPLAGYKVFNLDKPNFRVVTVHMFNPFVTNAALVAFLKQYGEVMSAARPVNDPLGFWTGKRQFQVLLNPDPEGPGGLKHPPAIFSLGGDRGYLYYTRQPAFCRRCRQSGHTEAACDGARCRFCGQAGHEAKNCVAPKACHGCGGLDHLFRSCPSRRRSFAEVAKLAGGLMKSKEPVKGDDHTGQVMPGLDIGLTESGVDVGQWGEGATDAGGADAPLTDMEVSLPAPTSGLVPSTAKEWARRGSQVFNVGVSTDNGEKGGWKKVRRVNERVFNVRREFEGEEHREGATEVAEEGVGTGQRVGGEVMKTITGEPSAPSATDLGLVIDLAQDPGLPASTSGEQAVDGASGLSIPTKSGIMNWAEEMERLLKEEEEGAVSEGMGLCNS